MSKFYFIFFKLYLIVFVKQSFISLTLFMMWTHLRTPNYASVDDTESETNSVWKRKIASCKMDNIKREKLFGILEWLFGT